MKKLLLLLLVALTVSKNLRFLNPAQDIIRGGSSDEEKYQVNGFENISNLGNGLKALGDGISGIIGALKTTKKDSLVKILNGNGFKELDINSEFFINKGLTSNYERYKAYWERKVQQLGLRNKPEMAESLKNFSLDAADSESSVWSKFDMAFKQGSTSNTYTACNAYVNCRESSGKYDIIITRVTGKFALADDLEVWDKSRSYVGGIFESQETKIVRQPRSLNKDDILTLLEIFKIVGVTLMTELLGIKPPVFPDLK